MPGCWEDNLGIDDRRVIIGRLIVGAPGRIARLSGPDPGYRPRPVEPLTPQEARVARLLCEEGCSYAEAGKRLMITPSTVGTLAAGIYRKLGCHRRRDACARLAAGE